jgi:hypothetical protein
MYDNFFDVDRFRFFPLDEEHLMAVARGPPCDAIPVFQSLAWGNSHFSGVLKNQCKEDPHFTDFPRYADVEEIIGR